MASQLIPIADSVKLLPGRESSATVELVFQAKALPPLGSHSYYVNQQVAKEKLFAKRAKTLHDGTPRSDITIQNDVAHAMRFLFTNRSLIYLNIRK